MTQPGGSYQQLDGSTAEAESARLQAQLQALFAHEVSGFEEVGFPKGAPALLEVGCGNGQVLAQLSRAFAPRQTFGVDLEAQHVSRAKAVAKVARANGARLPFSDARFDAVVFRYVLRHVPEPARLLGEAVRVLKPGGRLLALDSDDGGFFFDPVPEGWPQLSRALDESVRRRGGNPFSGRTLLRLFHQAGLKEVKAVGRVVTSSQLPAPLFVELLLAPDARPVDADLLAPEAAKAAWASLRAWARGGPVFSSGLGFFAGGVKG